MQRAEQASKIETTQIQQSYALAKLEFKGDVVATSMQKKMPGLSNVTRAATLILLVIFSAIGRPQVTSASGSSSEVTYLVNGLASNVASIGYGFRNLSRKIPNSHLFNYASPVESSTYILSKIRREILAAHRQNPNVRINLVGISFGANIVTVIATDLKRQDIKVDYLATIEGPAMLPVPTNVVVADNFSCTNLDCFRTRLRPALGNRQSIISNHKIKASHIPMGDHAQVHRRILRQINSPF